MTQDLRTSFEKLKAYSASINQTTDAAAAVITRVEQFLRDQCGVSQWAMVEDYSKQGVNDPPPDHPYAILGWDRADGQFRIVAQYRQPGEDLAVKPWANCNRETKLRSFKLLPKLIDLILDVYLSPAEEIEQVNETIRRFDGALSELT